MAFIVRNVTATRPRSKRRGGRQVERTVAEIGVRVGVEHDREVAVVDRPAPAYAPGSAAACGRSRAATCVSAAVMNSGWPSQRFSDARRSTAATTAASKPMPVWKQKKRPLTRPSPIGRMSPASMPPASRSTAATGSLGRPIVRANTFVEPPGSTPRAVSVPAMPVATSLSVPSPPKPTTTSTLRRAASEAKRVAWPRRLVSTSSTSWSRARRRCTTTVLRAVTDVANELTMSRMRKRRQVSGRRATVPTLCRRLLGGNNGPP